MYLEELREMEYVKCINLLAGLIDLDSDTKVIIYKGFQSVGIKNFFLHWNSVELPPEIIEKLNSIKAIIDLYDAKRRWL